MSATTVGVYDAKTRFTKLLTQVEKGESVTITRHGKPIAKIIPAEERDQALVEEAVKDLRTFSKGRKLGNDLTIRELIDEGRR